MRIIFAKREGARFLSHLDLMATFEYALRRAKIPFELSEGFNPRPRISMAAPLPLGYTGEREILEVVLREPMAPETLVEQFQAAVPAGIRIVSAEEYSIKTKSSASRVRGATYRIELSPKVINLGERIATLLGRPTLEVDEDRDGKIRRRDLRPLIQSIESPDGSCLRLVVRLDSGGTARPEQILDLLSIPRDGARITRERVDVED